MNIECRLQRTWGSMLESQVGGAIAGTVGGALGMVFQGAEDNNQRGQQQALDDIQINEQARMNQVNLSAQEQLWNYTAQPNQVKNMEAAGLNPALMYSGGGGGGQTAALNQGNVSGANAGSSQGMVLGMMQAQQQIELMKAQTKKIESETPTDGTNSGNLGNQLLDTQNKSLLTGITNTEAQTLLTKANTTAVDLANQITKATSQDQIDIIAQKYTQEAQTTAEKGIQLGIDKSTIDAKMTEIKANALTAYFTAQLSSQNVKNAQQTGENLKATGENINANTALTNAQTTNTQQQTAASKIMTANDTQRVQQAAKMITNAYMQTGMQGAQIQIDRAYKEGLIQLGGGELGVQSIKAILDGYKQGGALYQQPSRAPIGFKAPITF
nr:MAG: DNA pilot protein [Microviridae sp.]